MRRITRDLLAGLATLAFISTAFVGAAHIQPLAEATAHEARQA
ncbi:MULTISPECIES: hypothetical protein [unclassified Brevundimonas]|nr:MULTISPECIES: hypothetical protein [unclassified Brevundimonas]